MGAAGNGGGSCEMPMASNDADPIHRVRVDGFWMDATAVTNEQFEQFVKATGYVTIAERTPTKEEFPDRPRRKSGRGISCFCADRSRGPTQQPFSMVDLHHRARTGGTRSGPTATSREKKNIPSFKSPTDAEAYARWAGKCLPTEAEFEFAARGGLSGKTFVWGDELRPNGKWMANTWQGKFPVKDTGEDGFAGIAPVKSFPPNGYGLYDMAGNVWEWCSDWYRPDYYKTLAEKVASRLTRQGPDSPFDPAEPNERNACTAADPFFATLNIVRAILWAPAERRSRHRDKPSRFSMCEIRARSSH